MTAAGLRQEGLLQGTRYLSEGQGPTIVLVHGVGMDLAMWDPLARQLASHRRVVRYDMIGHGRSAKPHRAYRLADFVAQLARLADDLGLKRFDLAGFSMGGLVAQGFALAHGDRLDRLVLINTVFDRSPEERTAVLGRVEEVRGGAYAASVEAAIGRWFTPAFRATHPDAVESVRRHMLGNDIEAYASAYSVFASADQELAPEIHRIGHPTLAVTGAEDQRSTPAMARALALRLPRGRAAVIDGQRHMTPLEIPDRLASLIDSFLQKADEPAQKAIAP